MIETQLELPGESVEVTNITVGSRDDVEVTIESLLSIIRAERCRKELYQPPSPDLSNLLDNKANT